MNLKVCAERYRRELLENVLPFWLKHAPDPDYGGYFTCLDRDGNVYDTRKYVWLQGRAAWMFSKLYNECEPNPQWLEFARGCVDFLRLRARDREGRCYFSLTRDGQPAGYQRKPYAAVFMSLGLLEYAKATGNEACRREAIELFWDIDRWIRHPDLMDRPVLEGAPTFFSLADVMVRALLALEISAVDPDPRYQGVMRNCLFHALGYYDSKRRLFREFIGDKQFPESRLFCPGSSLEVSWVLLHIMERLKVFTDLQTVLDSIEGALEFGWDREYGGLYYFMDIEGRPLLQLEANMKLWWPHTEALYALVLAATMTGDPKWLPWLERIDDYAFQHFSDPEHGEWFGYCDRRGELTHTLKGNNYKGCFHVPRALLFSAQRIEKSLAPKCEADEDPNGRQLTPNSKDA